MSTSEGDPFTPGSTPGGGAPAPYGSTPGGEGYGGYAQPPSFGAPHGGGGPEGYAAGPPPGYGQGGYGTGGYGPGGYPAAPRNGLGTASLVLSLVGIVLWFIGPLLGIIFGFIGRSRAKRGLATNGGVALAGLIIGVVLLLGQIAAVVAIANNSSVSQLTSCLNNATTTQEQQACQDQFRQNFNR